MKQLFGSFCEGCLVVNSWYWKRNLKMHVENSSYTKMLFPFWMDQSL